MLTKLHRLLAQRRGAREVTDGSQASDVASQLEDSQMGGGGALDEEEVGVAPEAANTSAALREVEGEPQCDQLLGIDQAIVQCVDRCGQFICRRSVLVVAFCQLG